MGVLLKLGNKERAALESLGKKGEDVRQFRRAQALLWLDEGESVEYVAQLLHVSRQTVYNWIHRFRANNKISPPLRLNDAPRSGRPRKAHGVIDPLIDKVIDEDPREFGYRSAVWTSDLLVLHLSDTYGLEVSSRSVGYALERLDIRWKRPRYELSRRSPTWRQEKGGLNADCPNAPAPLF